MKLKPPKNDDKYFWTNHSKEKMVYYGISASLVKRIIRFPDRTEEGVAPKTTAAMKCGQNKKRPQEIWVMYRPSAPACRQAGDITFALSPRFLKRRSLRDPAKNIEAKKQDNFGGGTVKIISAWRYPGKSKPGKPIPIPEEILLELQSVI